MFDEHTYGGIIRDAASAPHHLSPIEEPMNTKLIPWLAAAAVVCAAGLVFVVVSTQTVRKDISSSELLQLQASGASIVDVRTQPEFESGHIASAVNVPVDQIRQVSATWDKNQPVVVYCATGARSAEAASYLAGAGFRKVYNLTSGLVAWTGTLASGAAASAASSGPGTVKTNGKPLFIEFATST
jgi:rhodanese-related sulfurtransferase